MNKIKWFFMSKYKKLLYQIEVAKENEQRLYLQNGIVMDFTNYKWDWNRYYGGRLSTEVGKYYIITRYFPTGNRKMELVKADRETMYFPEFTTHFMKLNIKPCDIIY